MAADTKGTDLAAFWNGIRDVLGLDPLPTHDRHGAAKTRAESYSDARAATRGEAAREARRFYVLPPDGSRRTPIRGSGA